MAASSSSSWNALQVSRSLGAAGAQGAPALGTRPGALHKAPDTQAAEAEA